MFLIFNKYSSFSSLIYNSVIFVFSYYYHAVLLCVFLMFLIYRIPYCYSYSLFIVFLVVFVFCSFICLFKSRLFGNINEFFGSFIPIGAPIYICPLIGIAELISYVIRPFVLILRPFINISLGCFGAVALCNLCFNKFIWFFILFIVFLYEVFVAIVH